MRIKVIRHLNVGLFTLNRELKRIVRKVRKNLNMALFKTLRETKRLARQLKNLCRRIAVKCGFKYTLEPHIEFYNSRLLPFTPPAYRG